MGQSVGMVVSAVSSGVAHSSSLPPCNGCIDNGGRPAALLFVCIPSRLLRTRCSFQQARLYLPRTPRKRRPSAALVLAMVPGTAWRLLAAASDGEPQHWISLVSYLELSCAAQMLQVLKCWA